MMGEAACACVPHEVIWCDGSKCVCVPHEGIWCDGSKCVCVLRVSGGMWVAVGGSLV